MKRIHKLAALAAGTLAAPLVVHAQATNSHEFDIAARLVYWEDASSRYPVGSATDFYSQSALGLQANYRSPYFNDLIGFDASLYAVQRLSDSGTPTTNLVEVNNSGKLEKGYTTLGQASVKLKLGNIGDVRLGRQVVNHLMLKSTATRAVPDTYSGVSSEFRPLANTKIYVAQYDRWRARSGESFEKFRTESTAAGVPNQISYLRVIGGTYQNGPYALAAEQLDAKDYLSKLGIVGSYTLDLSKTNTVKLSVGMFQSKDAGNLFRCGAEREMDCTGTGRIANNASAKFLDADWKRNDLTVGAAIAKFNGFWIEDNFAANSLRTGSLNQDHGTNPLPTGAALGPDFSNNNEGAWSARVAYDWKTWVPGLKTAYKYVKGTGAKSSNTNNTASGKEKYEEIVLTYALPFVKGTSVSYYRYKYSSSTENYTAANNIKGMPRTAWDQSRLYVDYAYKF